MLVQFGFWGCTYINRSSSYQFSSVWVFGSAPIFIDHSSYLDNSAWVLRPHLYQSVIFLSVQFSLSFQNRTYIDRLFIMSCQLCLSFWDCTYIDWSFVLSVWVQFEFLGPHLYRSVIHLVSWVESCSASSHAYLVESIQPWATPYHFFEFFFHVSITSCLSHLYIVHCIMVQCYSLHIHSSHHPHFWLESHLSSMCP